eukprot:5590999-Prorocentrum_lima.AAC.1
MGTFGMASAAYYWGRASALLVRLVHALFNKSREVWHLLYVDDGWITGSGPGAFRDVLLAFFVMEVLG